uniref:Ovule protein n=1 Tax=Caenorhabditis tropicalis TaxID=1561998 RepID=A0A1I7TFC3_9PELO
MKDFVKELCSTANRIFLSSSLLAPSYFVFKNRAHDYSEFVITGYKTLAVLSFSACRPTPSTSEEVERDFLWFDDCICVQFFSSAFPTSNPIASLYLSVSRLQLALSCKSEKRGF